MEFAGVELSAPVEKATIGPMEMAMMDLARVVTALADKAVRALEKATTDGWRGGDGGRRAAAVG